MANLTITVDDDVLLKARKRALEQATSVNAVLRGYLEVYATSGDGDPVQEYLDLVGAPEVGAKRG